MRGWTLEVLECLRSHVGNLVNLGSRIQRSESSGLRLHALHEDVGLVAFRSAGFAVLIGAGLRDIPMPVYGVHCRSGLRDELLANPSSRAAEGSNP